MEKFDKGFVIGIVVVALVLVLGGVFLLADSGSYPNEDKAALIKGENIPAVRVLGDENAKVTITVFSDLQCSACAIVVPQIEEYVNNTENVKLVFRHLPLESIHPNAYSAAVAAESAGEQGKFWELHDLLYATQAEWGTLANQDLKDQFIAYAKEAGVEDIDKFTQDLDSQELLNRVKADAEDAKKLGLSATPTVYVDSSKVLRFTIDAMDKLVQDKLN